MKQRLFLVAALLFGFVSLTNAAAPTKAQQQAKEALQQLGEFVGEWSGSGQLEGSAVKNSVWKESMAWGWRFNKQGDFWLGVDITDNKYFTKGDLKYLPAKKQYELTMTTPDKKQQVFVGELKKGVLEVVATDATTKDKLRLTMSTNNEGARLVYALATQPKGRGIFRKTLSVAHNKEGESIAAGGKKNECVVTGGLGTMAVSFQGKTYYVCCSGCRDAFNEEPAKFVKEFEEKQKKK
ncbi:hypothetical protein [Tuwongella immobilis]|uniref:YHS domain-containing protein n=1 Tax=Tuwongella immobilis TaxID=692036 RepID=A0A6C2YJ38_9BACT|nr:hypothetical protein [Tuwongella immobilis]VIP00992.1 Uncharacterized protein OS=Planctomyces maris DSM 8797 GN=PM8797T_07874 PE=4 SV=1: YHS [Tuwongella immobilis]VTR97407.1 Uncharacterized protein OS=Planctomyces maris DSM 8797 GN=PM8797T_07874 PE=4 SV=1: YHS [Tuwongella immobilis]